MKTWLRGIGTALAAGAIAVTACGGSTAGSGGGGSSSSCGRYFDANFTDCNGPLPPATELARERARFEQACAKALALPGISVTAAGLDACTSAIQAHGCNSVFQGVCNFGAGSLADGAHCASQNQCMSMSCTAGVPINGSPPTACGTCVAGQMCGTALCAANTVCVTNTAGPSCAPISFGSAGAACDGMQTQCNPGLVCNQMSHTCAQPGSVGSACASPAECADSLICPVGPQGMGTTCQNRGTVGMACHYDGDCTSDLGCDYSTNKCVTLNWASAGQPCGPTTRCLGAQCPVNGAASSTCPTVIADGQPCNANDQTQTCDTFATCIGTCVVLGTNSCP